MAINQDKLNEFLGKFVADFGATFNAGMVVIGDKLGLYKALAVKPMDSTELALATGTDERYVREWLSSQAAGGYVRYSPLTRAFSLSEEQAFALADETSPAYLPGAFELALAALKAVPKITEAFRTGAGLMVLSRVEAIASTGPWCSASPGCWMVQVRQRRRAEGVEAVVSQS